ncbi:hypothetical protein HID58_067023 [Brassica napus]|uniref:Uncharacterized protein n=1 Tax=Brassica napus TaxID=3708 RepID=A0ABQ7ZHB7_BRANA|nr:hypothetical protein HID58_067023 [Brassica napus]
MCILIPYYAELHLVGLGKNLVVIDVVFLVAGLPSIVSVRLGFQDRGFGDPTSMLFFTARGWLHGFLISFCLFLSLCSLISLHLSSLITSLVALSFAIFATPVVLKLKFWFLGGWLVFSPTQMFYLLLMHRLICSFVVLHWHEYLVCACLVCESRYSMLQIFTMFYV